MKNHFSGLRAGAWSLVAALGFSSVSCMTTYDTNGRAMQTVDPAVAIAGVAAAGLIGYAIANDNHGSNHYYGGGGYYSDPCDDYGYGGY